MHARERERERKGERGMDKEAGERERVRARGSERESAHKKGRGEEGNKLPLEPESW